MWLNAALALGADLVIDDFKGGPFSIRADGGVDLDLENTQIGHRWVALSDPAGLRLSTATLAGGTGFISYQRNANGSFYLGYGTIRPMRLDLSRYRGLRISLETRGRFELEFAVADSPRPENFSDPWPRHRFHLLRGEQSGDYLIPFSPARLWTEVGGSPAFDSFDWSKITRLVMTIQGASEGRNAAGEYRIGKIVALSERELSVSEAAGSPCGFTLQINHFAGLAPRLETVVVRVNGRVVQHGLSALSDSTVVSYSPPMPFPPEEPVEIGLSWTDNEGGSAMVTRSYTPGNYLNVLAGSANPNTLASGSGFVVRAVQTAEPYSPSDPSTIIHAEQQLGGGYYVRGNPATNLAQRGPLPDGRFTSERINWSLRAPVVAGNFHSSSVPTRPDVLVPGVPGVAGSVANVVVEALTYLELRKGCHVLGVNTVQGFTARIGHGSFGALIGGLEQGVAPRDVTFRVYAGVDGIYPVRLTWWNWWNFATNGGFEFFSVDATGGRHLVNDRSDPLALRAFTEASGGAYLETLHPYPGFKAAEPRIPITATFKNGVTSVDTSSIELMFNGAQVTPTIRTDGDRVHLTYLPLGGFGASTTNRGTLRYQIAGKAFNVPFEFVVRGVRMDDLANAFVIEFEQFDHGGGLSVPEVSTMPLTGVEYHGLGALFEVDYFRAVNQSIGNAYRFGESPNVPLGVHLELERPGFRLQTNYYITQFGEGDWYQFTRVFPPAVYRIVGAHSHAAIAGTQDLLRATYGIVRAGHGTKRPIIEPIGSYKAPSTGYGMLNALVPVLTNGVESQIALYGQQTIRVWVQSGTPDWFALVPIAPLTVGSPPGLSDISIAPGRTGALYVGETTSLRVLIESETPAQIQWFLNGSPVLGATNASLELPNLKLGSEGEYQVEVSNSGGTTRSAPARLRVIRPESIRVSTIAGTNIAGFVDSTDPTQVRFNSPNGLANFGDGLVAIADGYNHSIRLADRTGQTVTFSGFNSPGYLDGPAALARFSFPLGLREDSASNLLVADYENNRIRRIRPFGLRQVETIAGTGAAGYRDGAVSQALFSFPNDLAADAEGNIYVVEFNNHSVRKIATNGMVTTIAGNGTSGYRDGPGAQALFHRPAGIAIDEGQNLYVTEWGNQAIRKISPAGVVSTLAGGNPAGFIDGLGSDARFHNPDGITLDPLGNLYVTENANHSVRKIDPTGFVTTIAGLGRAGFQDGDRNAALFASPGGILWHPDAVLWVSDTVNHSLRRVSFLSSTNSGAAELSITLNPALTLHGQPGAAYRIEASEDPPSVGTRNWIVLETIRLNTESAQWFDPQPAHRARRFYRAIRISE